MDSALNHQLCVQIFETNSVFEYKNIIVYTMYAKNENYVLMTLFSGKSLETNSVLLKANYPMNDKNLQRFLLENPVELKIAKAAENKSGKYYKAI